MSEKIYRFFISVGDKKIDLPKARFGVVNQTSYGARAASALASPSSAPSPAPFLCPACYAQGMRLLVRTLALLLSLSVGCRAKVQSPPVHADLAPGPPSPIDMGAAKVPERILEFARDHGALHAQPILLPAGVLDDSSKGWLFFVGGQAAHAAWVFLPALNRFVPVEDWPHAVRVKDVLPPDPMHRLPVLLESLAARDQPAGLIGAVVLENDTAVQRDEGFPALRTSRTIENLRQLWGPGIWGAPDPGESAFDEKGKADAEAIETLFREASRSRSALAASLSKKGAEHWQVWQGVFAKPAGRLGRENMNATDSAEAVQVLSNLILPGGRPSHPYTSCPFGLCGAAYPGTQGLAVVREESTFRISAIFSSPSGGVPAPEQVSVVSAGDQAVHTARMGGVTSSDLAPVAQLSLGHEHLLALLQDKSSWYFVELQGALAITVKLPAPADAKVRFADLNGDGIIDIAVHYTVSHGVRASSNCAVAYLRGPGVSEILKQDHTGLDLEIAGARTIDEVVRLARAARPPLAGDSVSLQEACALLKTASTAVGFRKAAAPGAKLIKFEEPNRPALRARSVPSALVTDEHVSRLREPQCPPPEEDVHMVLICRGMLCGHDDGLDSSPANFFRFVRIGGKLRIARAAVYAGE